jgi:hypothetical protein
MDTPWQREFEDAFEYDETPDQARAIDDIKRDMESARPMDRLLCGDVGYGKTEVALRAAFKAVMDGKQVALLAPTTVLTQQHYQTCKERMADFPVRIELLNRFRTDQAAKGNRRAGEGGRGRYSHRHPPHHLEGREVQGPRPRHHRRRAALRRGREGEAQAPPQPRGRAYPIGHAHSPHAPFLPHRRARHEPDQHRAERPPAYPHRPSSPGTRG